MTWVVSPDMMQAFHTDGSLRDIYVFGTTQADWTHLLEVLRALGAEYFRHGEAEAVPKDRAALLRGDAHHLIRVSLSGVSVQCHAFIVEKIELDVAADDVSTPARAARVLSLMEEIGEALGKPVFLTEENGRHHIWFRYDPARSVMTYEGMAER